MGDAINLFAAFCYVVPGMPMIYTGQLSGNHHRLEFFEKDLIDTDEAYAQASLYKQLNDLRQRQRVLFSPEIGAPMIRIPADNGAIFACARPYPSGMNVIAVMNMSDQEQNVTLDLGMYAGKYKCLCGKTHKLEKTQSFTLKPWGFKIFEK